MINGDERRACRAGWIKTWSAKILLCGLIAAVGINGCGFSGDTTAEAVQGTGGLTYEVPKTKPKVLVDQIGYESESSKVVLFLGENLASTFKVVNADSDETVFTGEIIGGEAQEEGGEAVSYGFFTEWKKNGTYYIQTEIIGQSYPFIIGNDIYSGLIQDMCALIYGSGRDAGGRSDQAEEGSLIIQNLLLAYELYPHEFSDDTDMPESGNKIPDILDLVKKEGDSLLTMQDGRSGGVMNRESLAADREATAHFVAAMAQIYQYYQNYDLAYAQSCLAAAEKAWNYLKEESATKDSYLYMASAQMYKAVGKSIYHGVISEYHTQRKELKEEGREVLYGDIAYLSTKFSVDVEICSTLMNGLMNAAEKVAHAAQDSDYFVSGSGNEELFDNILCLSIVDHVITNHEYATVLENHLHYFLGRNAGGISYIEGAGRIHPAGDTVEQEITEKASFTSVLILMLCEIRNSDTGLEES